MTTYVLHALCRCLRCHLALLLLQDEVHVTQRRRCGDSELAVSRCTGVQELVAAVIAVAAGCHGCVRSAARLSEKRNRTYRRHVHRRSGDCTGRNDCSTLKASVACLSCMLNTDTVGVKLNRVVGRHAFGYFRGCNAGQCRPCLIVPLYIHCNFSASFLAALLALLALFFSRCASGSRAIVSLQIWSVQALGMSVISRMLTTEAPLHDAASREASVKLSLRTKPRRDTVRRRHCVISTPIRSSQSMIWH